jgi:hypothetical protein
MLREPDEDGGDDGPGGPGGPGGGELEVVAETTVTTVPESDEEGRVVELRNFAGKVADELRRKRPEAVYAAGDREVVREVRAQVHYEFGRVEDDDPVAAVRERRGTRSPSRGWSSSNPGDASVLSGSVWAGGPGRPKRAAGPPTDRRRPRWRPRTDAALGTPGQHPAMPERPGVDRLIEALGVRRQAIRGFGAAFVLAAAVFALFVLAPAETARPAPLYLALAFVLWVTVGALATAVLVAGAAYKLSREL